MAAGQVYRASAAARSLMTGGCGLPPELSRGPRAAAGWCLGQLGHSTGRGPSRLALAAGRPGTRPSLRTTMPVTLPGNTLRMVPAGLAFVVVDDSGLLRAVIVLGLCTCPGQPPWPDRDRNVSSAGRQPGVGRCT